MMEENLADGAVWTVVGQNRVEGIPAIVEQAAGDRSEKPAELLIHNIITHGNTASLNASVVRQDGSRLEYCDVFRFSGFGKKAKIKEITSYRNVTTDPCSPRANSQNDVPFMFFGVYNTNHAQGGADVGIFYDSAVNGWRGFIQRLDGYWDERSYVFKKPKVPYIHVSVPANEYVRLRLIDTSTWTQVDLIDYYLPGTRINGASQWFNREVSLAQHKRNYSSGAYLNDAHWHDVWIYSPTGQSLWTPQRTHSSYAQPANDQHINRQPISNYYEDKISIQY